MALPKTSSARPRALLALPLLCITLAGCSASGSSTSTTVDATGTDLTVFLSDPPAVRADPALQDVFDAEDLAWEQKVTAVKNVSLRLSILKRSVSDNARRAISNDSAIAYVGEIQPGQSVQTVGITNAEDILELSPTDTVRPDKNDYEDFSTYGRTFASLPLDLTTSAATLEHAVPSFTKTFTTDFGHAPSAEAIDGYDSVAILLRVLSSLGGEVNERSKIVSAVVKTLQGNQGQASVAAFTIHK